MADYAAPLTRRAVFAQAWPIMLGQASIPLVGLVDTVVIGRTGEAAALEEAFASYRRRERRFS